MDKTIVQIDAELDQVNAQVAELKTKAKALMAVRNYLILGEQLDHWGLTLLEYVAAKDYSAGSDVPLHVALNEARAKANKARRQAQTVDVQSAVTESKASGV